MPDIKHKKLTQENEIPSISQRSMTNWKNQILMRIKLTNFRGKFKQEVQWHCDVLHQRGAEIFIEFKMFTKKFILDKVESSRLRL